MNGERYVLLQFTNVLTQNFVEELDGLLAVIPVTMGIKKSSKSLDSGSRYPGLDPGLPGMTLISEIPHEINPGYPAAKL